MREDEQDSEALPNKNTKHTTRFSRLAGILLEWSRTIWSSLLRISTDPISRVSVFPLYITSTTTHTYTYRRYIVGSIFFPYFYTIDSPWGLVGCVHERLDWGSFCERLDGFLFFLLLDLKIAWIKKNSSLPLHLLFHPIPFLHIPYPSCCLLHSSLSFRCTYFNIQP